MDFNYSRHNLSASEQRWQRFFEVIPGLISWSIILGVTLLSLSVPLWAAVLIIAFYLYWLLRLLYMTIFLGLSFFRLHIERGVDWQARFSGIDRLEEYMVELNTIEKGNWRRRLSNYLHLKTLQALKKSGQLPPRARDIYHLIIYPVIKESRDIVEPGIKSLFEQKFPMDRMIVFLALEERASEAVKADIAAIEQEYKDKFFELRTVMHPKDRPGEAMVKGANITYAAKQAATFLESRQIPIDNVIVSCFDADTVVPKQFFGALTYYFMITPDRTRASFQPVPVYHNNVWDVPGFARVIEAGSSFFQLIEATNPEKMVTFSSHSMSFKALVEVGYWPVDMISDDSAIYWKSLVHYDGKYRAVPMYVTLSMDIAGSTSIVETAKMVYKQKRRWAWGVENFPIVLRAFLQKRRIPLYTKCNLAFRLLEKNVSWATLGFIVGIIGWLPAIFTQEEYVSSVMYYNVPRIRTAIFQLALLSLVASAIISTKLLARSKSTDSLRKKVLHLLEWTLFPVILVAFSAMPALDAQTRLMLGRHMEFWVTDKRRSK